MTLKNPWLIRNASFLKKKFDAKIFHPNTKWLKSFLVPGPLFRHKLSRLPLRQGSLPKNKPTSGNNFWRRICWWRSKIPGSSETPVSWKKNRVPKFFGKKSSKTFFRCRKMKRWESSETRFGQVSRRSEPSSGGKRPFKVCENFQFDLFGVKKWNVGNRLKRVLTKFRADRSNLRGVNGCLKFLRPNKPSPPKKNCD